MNNEIIDGSITNYGVVKSNSYDMVILPWGSIEPHNYHLPYITDGIIASKISLRVASQALSKYNIRCMVLPAVNLGSQNLRQIELPFCIHASYNTQYNILKDIVSSLVRQGQNKLLIINGHGGNNFKNMIRDLNVKYPSFLILVSNLFDMIDINCFFDHPGNHADEVETSMIMYFHPDLVDLNMAGDGRYKDFKVNALRTKRAWTHRNWALVSTDTGVGDPKEATSQKGEHCSNATILEYVEMIKELLLDSIYEK